jgi:opacity protein-like surface antigen
MHATIPLRSFRRGTEVPRSSELAALTMIIVGLMLRPTVALAQETVPPDIVVTRHIGVQGMAIAGVNWLAPSKSLEASGLSTKPIEIGGGVQVTNIWHDLFAQVNISRLSSDGERTFVDDDGTSFPLGIPLSVKATYVDVTAGWKVMQVRETGRPLLSYFGGGVGRVHYEERSPFALPGDDVDATATSYHIVGGVEMKLLSWLGIAGEVRYRWVPNLLGDGGTSAALEEKDFGGLYAGAGVTLGFGGPTVRRTPPPAQPQPPPTPAPEPSRIPERVADSESGTILVAAPVYLRPDANLQPLRTLDAGTPVKVLQENGDWIRIEFSDRILGPRVGYVLRKYIQLPK